MLNTRSEAWLEARGGSEHVETASLSTRQTQHRARLLVRPWHVGTGRGGAVEPGDQQLPCLLMDVKVGQRILAPAKRDGPERKPMATSIQMRLKSSP